MVFGLFSSNEVKKKYEEVYHHFLRDNFEQAEKAAHELLEKDPEHIKTLLLMAQIAEKNEHHKKAWEWYNKVLKIDKDNVQAYEGRAQASYNLYNFEEALEDYLYLYESSFKNTEYIIALGNVFQKLNLQRIALRYYKKAVKQSPKNIDAHLGLGYQQIILGEYSDAEDHVTKAKDLYYENKEQYERTVLENIENLEKQIKQLIKKE